MPALVPSLEMTHQFKSVALHGLRRCGVFGALRFAQRRRTVILAYHGVLREARAASAYLCSNFVSESRFEAQVKHLRRCYAPITMSEVVEALEGRRTLPERAVVVTFDDGFANNYDVAFPILRSYGVPFTVFLTTGMIGRARAQLWTERIKRAVYLSSRTGVTVDVGGRRARVSLVDSDARERASRAILSVAKRLPGAKRDQTVKSIEEAFGRPELSNEDRERYAFLDWEQVREMAAAGVEFGSHTVSHPILSTLDDATLACELVESRRQIEAQLGRPCDTFAYPNGGRGDFGAREQDALRRAGYRVALALTGGLVRADANPWAVERVNIGRAFDDALFDAALTGLLGGARTIHAIMRPSRATVPDPAAVELEHVH